MYSYSKINNIKFSFTQTELLTNQSIQTKDRWMPDMGMQWDKEFGGHKNRWLMLIKSGKNITTPNPI